MKNEFMTPSNPNGLFEVPKYVVDLFLRLSVDKGLDGTITDWCHYMAKVHDFFYDRFSKNLFKEHRSVINHRPPTEEEALLEREVLLNELFTNGVIIQVTPADRFIIEEIVVDGKVGAIVTEESIGRLRNWTWIKQGEAKCFVDGLSGLRYVVTQLEKIHDYKINTGE